MNEQQLQEAFNALIEGQQIKIDNGIFKVITSRKNECVFLQSVTDESKTFHVFYDEIDVVTDQFEIVV